MLEMGIVVEELQSLSGFEEAEEDWRTVLKGSAENEVFLTHEWLRAWWETYSGRNELLILQASEGGRPVGFAPLMIVKVARIPSWRKLQFVGTGPSDRCGLIAEGDRTDVHRRLWDHLRGRGGWDVLELRDMRAEGATAKVLPTVFSGGERSEDVAPFITLSGTMEDYLSALSSRTRKNISRGWRQLERDHGVEFVREADESQAEESFRSFVELNRSRWRGKSVLDAPLMAEFLGRAVARLSKRGVVVFHKLVAAEGPIAIQLGFEYEGRYLDYLAGFDPQFADLSPGTVLLAKTIEDCYERGLTEVDLLRGSEPYKYRFNAVDRRQLHFRWTREGVRRSMIGAVMERGLK